MYDNIRPHHTIINDNNIVLYSIYRNPLYYVNNVNIRNMLSLPICVYLYVLCIFKTDRNRVNKCWPYTTIRI